MSYNYQIIYLSNSIQKRHNNLEFFKKINNDQAVKIQLKSLNFESRIPDLLRK
ncbi:hypothetical protein L291_3173 [Acinetobacter guillouiae MSP4-18]|nr:hypothetical protein F981_03975 [Acinetobacter guillouiae CIP 63.46]EPH32514.1 hypothetical protein L291_3173 [Acinetobacter guillouiae MSP4-18]